MIEGYDKTVFHFDGNVNDADDIAALPVAALLAKAAGLEDEIVFFYGNNLAESNEPDQLDKMNAAADFAESLGIRTVGYQDNINGATAQLEGIFNNPANGEVLVIEGGPMEATYRALQGTRGDRLDNITQLSHSGWNENRDIVNRSGVDAARTWDDIGDDFPGVDQIEIRDQNGGFRDAGWNWMNGASNDDIAAAREIMGLAPGDKQNDASDAGMLYFALTGDQVGEPGDAQDVLLSSGVFGVGDPAPDDHEGDGAQDGGDDGSQDGGDTPSGGDGGDAGAGAPVAAYNIGGGAFVGADGTRYDADSVSNGRTYSVGEQTSIAGTQDDTLFRTEAWRPDRLDVEIGQIPDGHYRVELDFAEIYGPTGKEGGRTFDVQIEGGTKELDDFDVFAEAGFNSAITKTFDVAVTDGALNIGLLAEVQSPKLSAVRVFVSEELDGSEGSDGSGAGGASAALPQGFDAALVDTDTDRVIAELEGSDTIAFEMVAGRDVGLVVTSDRDDVDSVALAMDGAERLERVAPYALFGDTNGDYNHGVTLDRGAKTLNIEAFGNDNGNGTPLESFDIDFFIV